MSTWAQIVSVDSPDSSPCVIVGTRHRRFIFNAGEGSQRMFMEHRVRLTRAEHILVTHLNSDTLGGVPGIILTLSDIQKIARSTNSQSKEEVSMTLHGPPGLDVFFHATRHFMYRTELGVKVVCAGPGEDNVLRDEDVTIYKIPILASGSPANADLADKGGMPRARRGEDTSPPSKRPKGAGASNGSGGRTGDVARVGCVCYVCEPKPSPGKFDLNKAKALGIPAGPIYGRLQRGEDVTVNGRLVRSSEVVGKERRGAPTLIVACPSADLIPSLVSHPDWERFYTDAESEDAEPNQADGDAPGTAPARRKGPGNARGEFDASPCVVHMAPAEVMRSPAYQAWSQKFGRSATHVVTAQPYCSPHTLYQAAHDQALKLNRICSAAFAKPKQFVDRLGTRQGDRGRSLGGGDGGKRGSGEGAQGRNGDRNRGAILPESLARIPPSELDFGGNVVAAVPLMRFKMLQASKEEQVDMSECLSWEKAKGMTATAMKFLDSPKGRGAFSSSDGLPSPSSPPRSPARRRGRSSSSGGSPTDDASSPERPAHPPGAEESVLAFLGTGSALPSKYRNVSGIWVRFPPERGSSGARLQGEEGGARDGDGHETAEAAMKVTGDTNGAEGVQPGLPTENCEGGSMLLDAGEGSFGQLWRVFGDSASNLKASEDAHGEGHGPRQDEALLREAPDTSIPGSPGKTSGPDLKSKVGAQSALRDLSAVWISHPHADHHLGLVRILSERNKLLRGDRRRDPAGAAVGADRNLLLMGPAPVAAWLKEYAKVDPTVKGGYDFLDASLMLPGKHAPRPPPHIAAAANRALARAGVVRATSVRVRHCAHAYALVLTVAANAAKAAMSAASAAVASPPGRGGNGAVSSGRDADSGLEAGGGDWKLVYSGDCRPCEDLVREGKGAAVLIHEATFDESKQQEAYEKNHCTMKEALGVAKRMEAERVVLTHFSQRYQHLPVMGSGGGGGVGGGIGSNVSMAFDFMRVRIPDLSWLPRYLPTIQAAFSAEESPGTIAGSSSSSSTATSLLSSSPDKVVVSPARGGKKARHASNS